MALLCIDDNQAFLQSMVERLRLEGYDADAFDSIEAAVNAFKINPFRYDVVITDMEFPGEKDGEELIDTLIKLREERGYDPAPEIVCITGAKTKMDARLLNRVRDRGCRYVLKGTDQYFIEMKSALIRLQEYRGHGPTFRFTHTTSEKYIWNTDRTWPCSVGESISAVHLLYSDPPREVEMDPTPRRVFDFLARHTSRRAFSVEEVANGIALDDFYAYWSKGDKTTSSESIKNNVRRIRVALNKAFEQAGAPFNSAEVLSTQAYEDKSERFSEREILSTVSSIKSADVFSLVPYSERSERYRVNAKIYVEHIP